MPNVRKCLSLLLLVMIAFQVNAQRNWLTEATAAFNQLRYYEAIELYKKAYTNEKEREGKAHVIFKIAESYRLADNPRQAEVWYSKAIKSGFNDPIAIYYLAECMKINGKLESAGEQYKKYVEEMPNDPKGRDGLKSVELITEWQKSPTRYEVVNAPIINSENDDIAPCFVDSKNNDLVFVSTREGATGNIVHEGTGQSMSDLFISTRDRKGKWSEPKSLNEPVNTIEGEGPACINNKGNTLYFTRCGYGTKGVFGCQIYSARKSGQNWGEPELIPITADTNTVGHPAIGKDDKTLIFASNMPGGYGGRDLWYIVDKGKGVWSEPINLGSAINTSGNEYYPFVNYEGKLFFASNGHIGMGGMDIFVAEPTGENQWGNVKNLQIPINSTANDMGIVFEGQHNRGYLASDRPGGMGEMDIWEFYWPPLVFALEGVVVDKETKKPIAGATIQLKGTDGSTAEIQSDGNGEFKFDQRAAGDRYIRENTSYNLLVSAPEYLNAKGNETTVGDPESKVYYHEYQLQPVDKPIKLPEVLFELGKWDLLPQSKDSLNFLYDILIDNPTICIELSAHTDSRDTDERNRVLSQKRAESCVNYLIERGIPRARMEAKGYGESRPRITDAQIDKMGTKDEKEAAHAQNRRVEFEVLDRVYTPK